MQNQGPPPERVPLVSQPVSQIELAGLRLVKPDGTEAGRIIEELRPLGACDQHTGCIGPVVRLQWTGGKARRECLYTLIQIQKYQLKR